MRRIEDVKCEHIARGVLEKLDRDEYMRRHGLNPSSLKKASPKHVKFAYENDSEPTDAMRLGTAVHTLVWEPHLFESEVVAFDGVRRGKAWDEFQAEHDGKLILKQDAYDTAVEIATAVCADPIVKELAREGLAETAVFTEEHGLQCRGLIDWIATHQATMVDLKVVSSIEPRMFGNAVLRFGWDVSMACYVRWFTRESGKRIDAVKFVCVESKPPHDVVVVNVSDAVLESGWRKAEAMIRRVKECIETGVWPGIANGQETELYVPAYAMDEEQIDWEA